MLRGRWRARLDRWTGAASCYLVKKALIIGASGGIGAALCDELRARQVDVTALSRSVDGLDVTDEASVEPALGALAGQFDLIVIATGALEGQGTAPEKTLQAVTARGMAELFAVNCIGPALILKHAQRLLPRDRRAVVVALSARVGSIGDNRLGGWYAYRTAKAALNQMVHTAAIELGRTHPRSVCVVLHPGTVATDLTARYAGRHPTVAPSEAARNLLAVIAGLSSSDSGGFFDWQGAPIPW